jgi:hypothetical protein
VLLRLVSDGLTQLCERYSDHETRCARGVTMGDRGGQQTVQASRIAVVRLAPSETDVSEPGNLNDPLVMPPVTAFGALD